MVVIYKSIYMIDYENDDAIQKEAPEDFNQFIQELIQFVSNNHSVRKYQPYTQTTQVVNCSKQIVSMALREEGDLTIVTEMFHDIASKLLRVEVETQERIAQTGQQIKKGSLIQALLYSEDDGEYSFLIAKVEHTGFVDDEDYSYKSGFSRDERNIWKSCVFDINVDEEEVTIDSASIYLQRKATYWAQDFLDLKEMIDDESNTKLAWKWIESTLTHNIKQDAPSDYLVLRNHVIGYLRNPQHIDYNTMIENIFANYEPIDISPEELLPVKDKLLDLPEKKCFDRQFTSVPNAIRGVKIRKVFHVNQGIEIKLTGHVDDFKNKIKSHEDIDQRYIQIITDSEEVFRAFLRE